MIDPKLLNTPAPFAPTTGMPRRPGDGFVIQVDEDAIMRKEPDWFRFIGLSEKVDLRETSRKFHTMTPDEIAAIIGHPVITGADGKPILGEHDRKVFAAGLLLRHGIIDNPNYSRKQKRRMIDKLRDETIIKGGMVPPIVQDMAGSARAFGGQVHAELMDAKVTIHPVDNAGGRERFTSVEIGQHPGGKDIEFPRAEIETLLGRKVNKGADGYDDLTSAELGVLGTAAGALEAIRGTDDRFQKKRLIAETVKLAREEHGLRATQRILAFLRLDAQKRIKSLDDESIGLKRQIEATKIIAEWVAGEMKLQRPNEGAFFSKVQEAAHARDIIPLFVEEKMPVYLTTAFDGVAHSFVIEHDWNRAFAGATDFDAGEVHLPFPECAFEFQISGRRIVVILQEDEIRGTIALPLISTKAGWVLPMSYTFESGKMKPQRAGDERIIQTLQPMADLIGSNIRAVSITLEAEITETTIVRVPHLLNRAREKRGKLPLVDYHVVSLAHRTRSLPREEPLDPDREITRKRLHFRRGHDRHFPTYKVWIKWCLVGDPDLGFVDKHYKL